MNQKEKMEYELYQQKDIIKKVQDFTCKLTKTNAAFVQVSLEVLSELLIVVSSDKRNIDIRRNTLRNSTFIFTVSFTIRTKHYFSVRSEMGKR